MPNILIQKFISNLLSFFFKFDEYLNILNIKSRSAYQQKREREFAIGESLLFHFHLSFSNRDLLILALTMMKYMKPLSLYQDLLKVNAVERGRLLGLDVGDKYVGLAVSDFNNKVASPFSVLVRKKSNIRLMAIDLKLLISELSLSAFIVGYPYDRQRISPEATQVKVFVDDLCKTGKLEDVRYTFWDECFTSKNVELLLKPLNLPPVEAKTISDKFAAVGILQGYLDYVNRNVETEQTQ
ncbi:hypothetical protein L1887_29146 [Cichorium endivia]|nr:hypothetical protein L1887_29146 [Cichorium endivia]